MRRIPNGLPLCCTVLLGLALPLAAQDGGAHGPPTTVPPQAQVNKAFGLRASEVVELDVGPRAPLATILPLAGRAAVLRLVPYSVRSDDYQVFEQSSDGTLTAVEPGPVRTVRGDVVGIDGAQVVGSLTDDGLHVAILHADGSRIWLEPLRGRFPRAARNQYLLYRDEDVIASNRTCAAGDSLRIRSASGSPSTETATSNATGSPCTAELACDADYEYFQAWGSTGAVETRINTVIGAMNVQYERDVGITHVISTVIVRTSESGPYTSTDAVTLLNQLRAQWESFHGSIERDVVQLFTGKEIDSNTIGIAWLGSVCSSYGYSMVQSDFAGTGSLACTTDLSAHELGHSWGADHCGCQRPQPYTMNSFITCANQFHPRKTIPEILSFRDSLSCVAGCESGAPPPPDPGGCTTDAEITRHDCSSATRRPYCLYFDVTVACGGAPVANAVVTIELEGHEAGDRLTGSAETDSSGSVRFALRCKQAKSSTYTSTVVSIDGVDWTPGSANSETTCSIE